MYLSSTFARFREFATRSPVGEFGARMLGVDQVTLFNDELLVKEPATPQETPWHHDMPYWPLGGDSVCSVWIPLDRVTRHAGDLECGRPRPIRDPRLGRVEPSTAKAG